MDTKIVAPRAPTSGVAEDQSFMRGEGALVADLQVGEKEVRTFLSTAAHRPPGSPQDLEAGEINYEVN